MKEKAIKIIVGVSAWLRRNLRAILIWLFLVALFMIFETKVSSLISEYNFIGESEVNGRYFNILYKTIKILGLILFSFLFIKNYRLSKHLNFWILFLGVAYFILKTNQNDLIEFISIPSDVEDNTDLYADIFLYLAYIIGFLFVRNLFGDFKFYDEWKTIINRWLILESGQHDSIYQEDIPIEGSVVIDNDIIVSTLANQIADLYPINAFVIGINGEWGNGKTTFLKRLENKLKFDSTPNEKAPIIFWFNAWQHQEEKSIINNFFNQLKKELANYSGDAKDSINKYLSKLLALFDSKYSSGITFLSEDLLRNQSTIKDYYENIDSLISMIDRRIVIFVDDLDRLNKTEIIEVVRILRNVANFKNTIFICGFDKNYVIKTGGFKNNFLDKIFNLEINLPKLHQNGLLIFFENIINSSRGIDNKKKIIETFNSLFDTDTDISLFDISIEDIVEEPQAKPPKFSSIPLSPSLFFGTRRDIKRFYNSLVTDLNILGNIEDVEIEDYLFFKLLVFKYSWLLSHFGNNRINLWLGDGNTLKVEDDKLDFLANQEELELIDQATIYTVLIRLFPTTSTDSYEEGSRKINQRRYLPIYLNNNIFNQSFSYSNLISAHGKLEIGDLIDNKIKGKSNENHLLNDIKNFILKEENLNTVREFEQAVEIIKTFMGSKVSDYELIQLVHIGEKIEGFKELADNKMFIDIDNVFGQFLRLLNRQYTRVPKEVSTGNDDIGSYLSRHKLNELPIIDGAYVKNKVLELYTDYLSTERTIEEASRILFDCTNADYHYFSLYLYYDEANELFKAYMRNNFSSLFFNKPPKEFLKFISGDIMASIFVTDEAERNIKDKANDIIQNRNQFSSSDLDKSKFLIDGWNNFLDFFKETYTAMELNAEELQKAEKFYAFVYTYIKKGFIIPTEQEVLMDEISKKLLEIDKKKVKEEEEE